MKLFNNKVSIKELGSAALNTIKRKPLISMFKLAGIIATIAISILMPFLLPLASLPIIITLSASYFSLSALLSSLFFQDIKESLFTQFKKDHSLEKINNQNMILVLEAKHDHNGAFQEDQRPLFQKLERTYPVAFEIVSSIEDVANCVERARLQNNQIKALWLRAHGNPHEMTLDKDKSLSIDNTWMLEHHFNLLEPEAFIILDSCSTGRKNPYYMNLAQNIASYARKKTIISSSEDTLSFSMKIDKTNPLNVQIWTPHPHSKNRLFKHSSTFINTIKALIFELADGKGVFKKLAFNATQVYRYP